CVRLGRAPGDRRADRVRPRRPERRRGAGDRPRARRGRAAPPEGAPGPPDHRDIPGGVMTDSDEAARKERMRRWRLVLGGPAEEALGAAEGRDGKMDAALSALYDPGENEGEQRGGRSAGLGGSAPKVARWLGDIREYFPSTVVQVMQADAIERLDLTRLLTEPEMLQAVQPGVHLVGTLLSLNRVMPDDTKDAARQVVRTVVADLEKRIAQQTRAA